MTFQVRAICALRAEPSSQVFPLPLPPLAMSIRSSQWRTYDQSSATALTRSNSCNSTSSTLARAAPVLSKMTRTRTSTTDLSVALATLDWSKAKALAKGVPAQAAQWSKRQGFFEGVKPSHCLPLHEACVTNAPAAIVTAILQAYPDGVRCKESSYNRYEKWGGFVAH